MEIKISYDTQSEAPLYLRYDGQSQPQSAFMEIDPSTGEVAMCCNCEIGNAVPMRVWHGLAPRVSLSPYLSRSQCESIATDEEVIALIRRAIEGYSERWDGSNHVGSLTRDAIGALDDLERLLESAYEGDVVEIDPGLFWCETDIDALPETEEQALAEAGDQHSGAVIFAYDYEGYRQERLAEAREAAAMEGTEVEEL